MVASNAVVATAFGAVAAEADVADSDTAAASNHVAAFEAAEKFLTS